MKLIIWGGLWFPLKSFHARMIRALPAALRVNADAAAASLVTGIGLYLSYCKPCLKTGASVVYLSWILSRDRTKKEASAFCLYSTNLRWSHAFHRGSRWIMTHRWQINRLNRTQGDAYFVSETKITQVESLSAVPRPWVNRKLHYSQKFLKHLKVSALVWATLRI